MNIVLIGPRASGKTTVGRILSSRLKRPFQDTDELIEKSEGISIGEIIRLYGWPYFRNKEKEIISDISVNDNSVISVGGGAVLEPINRERLKRNSFIVWLNAELNILIKRMLNDSSKLKNSPTLTGKGTLNEFKEVLLERERLYESISDLMVDTSYLEVEEVVRRIISVLNIRIV